MKRLRHRRQRHNELHALTTAVQALTSELRTWRMALIPPHTPAVVAPMEGLVPIDGAEDVVDQRATMPTLEDILKQRAQRDPNDLAPGYEALE